MLKEVCFAYKTDKKYSEEEIKALNKKGVEAFRAGRFEEAIPLFRKVVGYWKDINRNSLDVSSPSKKENLMNEARALYNLGSTEMKCGRFSQAKTGVQIALGFAVLVGAKEEKAKYKARLRECKEHLGCNKRPMPSP